MTNQIVLCSYCMKEAELVDSKEIYGRSYGLIYLCRPCDAYVGVHKETNKPLGTLANEELREWRKDVHAVFDPLWKEEYEKRDKNRYKIRHCWYQWLSTQLDLPYNECHIGMFNIDMCKKAHEVCMNEHFRTDG